MKTRLFLPLLMTTALAAPAAVHPIYTAVSLHSYADAGLGEHTSDQFVGGTSDLGPWSATTLAQAFNGTKKATVQTSAQASWSSANAGQLTFDTKFSIDDLHTVQNTDLGTGAPVWTYTFITDRAATFTLNYNISYQGTLGYSMLPIFYESINGDALHGTVLNWQEWTVPSQGSLSLALNPGQAYTLQLWDDSNIHQYLWAFTSEMTGVMNFQITEVPEPRSLGLLALGLAGAGWWYGGSRGRNPAGKPKAW